METLVEIIEWGILAVPMLALVFLGFAVIINMGRKSWEEERRNNQ